MSTLITVLWVPSRSSKLGVPEREEQDLKPMNMYIMNMLVLLKIRFLDVAQFTALTPLSLLISCKLSCPIVGLKIFSLPTSALISPNKIVHVVFREFMECMS
jgi:hypothetical protein